MTLYQCLRNDQAKCLFLNSLTYSKLQIYPTFCKTHDMVLQWSVELAAILRDVLCSNKLPVQLHVQHRIRLILQLTRHLQSSKVQAHLALWPGNDSSESYRIRLFNWSLNLFFTDSLKCLWFYHSAYFRLTCRFTACYMKDATSYEGIWHMKQKS